MDQPLGPVEGKEKSEGMLAFEARMRQLGHPESSIDPGTKCAHKDWSFAKHGRYCPCDAVMVDMGD